MKICHVCGKECTDEMEFCDVCGADLTISVEEITQEDKETDLLNNPMVVASLEDVVSAEIFKDLLNEKGIKYTSNSLEGSTMKVSFGGAFVAEDICVDESDYEKASEIYEEFINAEPEFDDEFFEENNISEE